MHKLTVADVKAAKTAGAPRKLVDGGGLYLLLSARGSKYWRYDYRFAGKRKTLALGVFPEVSLAEARKSHFLARESLREGADPGETKKIQKKIAASPNPTPSSPWPASGLSRRWPTNQTAIEHEPCGFYAKTYFRP